MQANSMRKDNIHGASELDKEVVDLAKMTRESAQLQLNNLAKEIEE